MSKCIGSFTLKELWTRNKSYAFERIIRIPPTGDNAPLDALCTFISHEFCRKCSGRNYMVQVISLYDSFGSGREGEVIFFLCCIWIDDRMTWQKVWVSCLSYYLEQQKVEREWYLSNYSNWNMKADDVKQSKHKGNRLCKVWQGIPAKKEKEVILKWYMHITYFKVQDMHNTKLPKNLH